jgi:hypothetical protein
MADVILSAVVGADRRLVIDLPAEMPLGPVTVVVRVGEVVAETVQNPAREAVRAKLLAGGALDVSHQAPPGAISLSNDRLAILGQLAPGARSSEEIIDEERGAY